MQARVLALVLFAHRKNFDLAQRQKQSQSAPRGVDSSVGIGAVSTVQDFFDVEGMK